MCRSISARGTGGQIKKAVSHHSKEMCLTKILICQVEMTAWILLATLCDIWLWPLTRTPTVTVNEKLLKHFWNTQQKQHANYCDDGETQCGHM